MWIFTQSGFVSAVQHYYEPNTFVVRARDFNSLETFATLADVPVERTPVNDYPYRVQVLQHQFCTWLQNCVDSVDYTNFKDRVHDTRGETFATALMSVWGTMHDVEDEEARKRR